MATKDFRASQIRTSQIIGSGSQSGKPTILVVSASDSSGFNGEALDNSTLLANVGSDVFLFVTGSKNTRTAVTLFGGDVVISGTMYADKQVVEVDLATTGSLSISGSLHVSQSATIYEGLVVNESGEGGPENDFRVESDGEDEALFLDASANTLYINKGETAFTTIIGSTNDEAVRVGSAGVVFNEDGHATNDFRVESDTEPHALFVDAGANELHINSGETAFLTTIHNVDGEAVSITATEVVINDDGVSTIDLRAETNNKTHALFIDAGSDQVLILSGGGVESPDESSATDLAFFVSGTIGSKDSTNKGTAVFGGDVVISGSHYGLDDIIISSNATISGSNLDIANKVRHIGDTSTNISFDTEVIAFSLAGDAGLMLDRSPSGAWPHTTFNLEGNNFDFGVVGNDGHVKLYLSGNSATTQNLYLSASQVLIGADYRTAFAPPVGDDTVFFVSGVMGSKDSETKGVALFSGDTVVSGAFHVLGNGSSSGQINLYNNTSFPTIQISGSTSQLPRLLFKVGGGTATEGSSQVQTMYHSGAEGGLFGTWLNDGGRSAYRLVDRDRVSNPTRYKNILYYSASTVSEDQSVLLFLSSSTASGATSPDPVKFTDTNFWVSGTIGSKDSTNKGTAVFGGDVVVSGALHTTAITSSADPDTSIEIGSTANQISFFTSGGEQARINTTRGIQTDDYIGHLGDDDTYVVFSEDEVQIWAGGKPGLIIDENATGLDVTSLGGTTSLGKYDQVLILSGGGATSYNEATGADVTFYVSGTAGSKGTSVRGTSVFGGDVCTSGTLYPNTMLSSRISGSLTHLTDGTSYLIAGSNVTITTGSSGAVTIASTGGGGGAADAVGWSGPANSVIATTGSLNIGTGAATPSSTDIFLSADGAAVFNEQGASVDFRVESNLKENALFVDGSTDQVLILSGGGVTSVNEAAAADVAFYVSGAIDSRSRSGSRGMSLFGGDLTTSGALAVAVTGGGTDPMVIIGPAPSSNPMSDTSVWVSGSMGSKDTSTRGTAVFGGDAVVSGTLFANDGGGSLGLQSTSTGTALKLRHDSDDFVDFSVNSSGMLTIAAAGSAAGGGVKIDVENSITLDVNEAEEGIYYADGGTNLLQIYNDGSQNVKFQISQGSKTLEMEESDGTSLLKAGNDQILILSGGGATSYNEAAGSDVNFYVSGTAGSMGSSTKGTAVFGGDVVVSGTLSGGSPLVVAGGLQITGTLDVSSSSAIKSTSLSGSLTKLIDGTSYLIAGANVTIATGSSGAVTIASTGGGAADAVGWTGPANSVIATTGSLNIGTTSATPGDSDIFLSANGAAVFNEQGASVDFRVESNTKSNALLVDGSTDQVLILSGGASSSTNEAVGADVNFYVSGSTSSASTSARGTSLFGGDLVASGTILPGTDLGSNLGAPTRRFGNIYTGDLHLRNERGNWTIVEEADYLCVVNNLTGKKFKMALIPLDDD